MKLFAWIAAIVTAQAVALSGAAFAQEPPPQALAVPPGYEQAPPAPPPMVGQPQQPTYGQQPPYAQQPIYAQQPGYYAPQPAAPAVPPGPDRQGFTLELGLGIAWLGQASHDFSEFALHGLNLTLGAFLSPSTAIEVRITGASVPSDFEPVTFANLLGNVQYWANDWLMIAGGIGFGVLQATSFVSDVGLSLDARVGAAFARWPSGVMRVALEFVATLPGSELTTMLGLALDYQYY